MTLVLYRWHLDAAGTDPPAERRRFVESVVKPVFHDAAVLGVAECLYAGKYHPPGYPTHEVHLTLVVNQDHGEQAAGAVAVHLVGERVAQRVGPVPGDVLCRARAAWYRERLMDTTRVALDLHGDPAHVPALRAMWSPAQGAQLDAYLSTHSAAYREVCSTDETRAAFWRDFWRRGPEGLSCPGHWIENLLAP